MKLWTQPQITPQWHTVHGATADETVLNTTGVLPLPAGVIYQPEEWDIYSNDPAKRTLVTNENNGNTDAEIFAACPEIRNYKAKQIRSQGDFQLRNLVGYYLEGERETWPIQREEAMRWKTGGMQDTPYCDAIARGRGITREAFLQAVIDNTELFSSASAAILGKQQAALDRVYAATSVTAVLAEVI